LSDLRYALLHARQDLQEVKTNSSIVLDFGNLKTDHEALQKKGVTQIKNFV